jgi:chemotaxis protein methyltransferase CheR
MTNNYSVADYEIFRGFLSDTCGIELGSNKQYLVSSRLHKLLSENEIPDLTELVSRIRQASHRSLKQAVIDAMTTNETLWFRDSHPFDIFKHKLLPEFMGQGKGALRVWSAACSSGQEPYSLSMIVDEYHQGASRMSAREVEFVATDLSAVMLEQCKKAEYGDLALGRGLSQQRLKRYFDPLPKGCWKVKQEIRARVRFQSINLKDSYRGLGKFDIVFCRNVLIYFSAEMKLDILRRIRGVLRPGGYLVLGASEGLTGLSDHFEMVQCRPGIIYRAI